VIDGLVPGEIGDDMLLRIISALRSDGAEIDVEDAGGAGPYQALAIVTIDGRRVRLTAEPW